MSDEFVQLISRFPDLLALAAALLAAGFLVARVFPLQSLGRYVIQLAAFAGFTAVLIVAGVEPSKPKPALDWTLPHFEIGLLKIVWWLTGAWLLSRFFRGILVFKRQARETRFLQDLLSGFVYVSAGLAIIAYVFDLPVSGLLAASGVIAIVLGLALQSTLGDVFSGIVLNIAKPYQSGDWVIFDDGKPGRIIETDWRATKILTDNNDLAIIPNSLIAKSKIINASKPTNGHGITVTLRLDPAVEPARGCAMLETALLSCNTILRTPASVVMVRSHDALALECEVQFFVASIEQGPTARNEMFDRVYRHGRSASIRLAPPAGSPFALAQHEVQHDPADLAQRLLKNLPIFASLSEAEQAELAPKMRRRVYEAGDILISQGAIAQALFILASGVLVALRGDQNGDGEVTRLAPGDSFGQAGLLTGAAALFDVKALTRSIVYEIAKDDLSALLRERPSIAVELGHILAQREAAIKAHLEELAVPDKRGDNLAARLAERVKDLFGLA